MEKFKNVNFVGIVTAVLFAILLFVPFVTIAGTSIKIVGTDLKPLVYIGAIPSTNLGTFELILKYSMYTLIVIAVVVLIFSIFPVGFINVLFMIIGILFSIVFVLIDIFIIIIYVSSSQFAYVFSDKLSIGVGIVIITIANIMLFVTGITGLSKKRNK